MKLRRRILAGGLIAALAALTAASGSASADQPESTSQTRSHRAGFTFAVIGDLPYGDAELAAFPGKIAQINADPDVRLVDHLGDIKSGSTVCSDAYFDQIKADFDTFADPLVYAVGDNEWTDCHRPSNGGYDPLERLGAIRSEFFAQPNWTLGQHTVRVRSQARFGYPENVRYARAGVGFAALHIVGSNNGLEPWTGNTTATPEQTAEVLGRTAATVGLIRETFATAKARRHRAVVLMAQADMFDPTVSDPTYADYYAFQPIVTAIAQESARFSGPVYLFNGDSHVYNRDVPLGPGSPWLGLYGLRRPVTNLTRITVDGSTDATNYLKVTIHPRRHNVLTWTRVPYDPSPLPATSSGR